MSILATSGLAAQAGDCVPAHSLAETLKKLDRLLRRAPIDRLVVAGDLVESSRPCADRADLAQLARWLGKRGVRTGTDRGEPRSQPCRMAREKGLTVGTASPLVQSHMLVAGWTIAHGHRLVAADRLISGHHHPVLRVSGHSAPAFWWGMGGSSCPPSLAMPQGWTSLRPGCRRAGCGSSLHCLASTGGDLLDFGPLKTLHARPGMIVRCRCMPTTEAELPCRWLLDRAASLT